MSSDHTKGSRPIYTVPRDSAEYERRRDDQYRRGIRTFFQAIALFGGAIVLYFLFRN